MLAQHFSRSLGASPGRLHFAAHSHHPWPDATLRAQEQCWLDAAGVRTVEGQFTMKRLPFRIGEGPWADTDTVADEVLVRFRFTLHN